MPETYIQDTTFEKRNFFDNPLAMGEYENCVFTNCDFAEADLSKFIFTDCEFKECNLSLAKLQKTALREVKFVGCKMLGLVFSDCNPFGLEVSFQDCQLQNTSFYQTKIKKTIFRNSNLQEVDFSEADCTEVVFYQCDLDRAIFDHSNLEKADFTTAENYAIDPEANRIRKARFSLSGLPGLLEKYGIDIQA